MEQFDHHCNWLNNCIGKHNYKYFLALLFLVLALCLYQLGIDIAVVAVFHVYSFDTRMADFYSSLPHTMTIFGYVMVSISILSQLLFVILVVELLFLHRWLKSHELTTFEYIIFLREKADNPNLELDANFIRRMHKSKVVTRVNQEGRGGENSHNANINSNQVSPADSEKDPQRIEEEKKNELVLVKVNPVEELVSPALEPSPKPQSFFERMYYFRVNITLFHITYNVLEHFIITIRLSCFRCKDNGKARTAPEFQSPGLPLTPSNRAAKSAPKTLLDNAVMLK